VKEILLETENAKLGKMRTATAGGCPVHREKTFGLVIGQILQY
jgi:hypothetical protein